VQQVRWGGCVQPMSWEGFVQPELTNNNKQTRELCATSRLECCKLQV
jgi:hypothetical protein